MAIDTTRYPTRGGVKWSGELHLARPDSTSLPVRGSITAVDAGPDGLAHAAAFFVDVSELEESKEAMRYRAKREDQGRYRFFDESMSRTVEAKMRARTDLAIALPREELELLYQPIFHCQARRCVGAEALLRQLPFGAVKIARGFVEGIDSGGFAAHLVDTILHMARGLELDVVAEDVETEAQLAFLRERGCDFAQGCLLGEPLPQGTFLAFLGASGPGISREDGP